MYLESSTKKHLSPFCSDLFFSVIKVFRSDIFIYDKKIKVFFDIKKKNKIYYNHLIESCFLEMFQIICFFTKN